MAIDNKITIALLLSMFISLIGIMFISNTNNIQQYLDGAMTVYTKFDSPNKQQSDEFLSYIKSEWKESNCFDCRGYGVSVAEKYVSITVEDKGYLND